MYQIDLLLVNSKPCLPLFQAADHHCFLAGKLEMGDDDDDDGGDVRSTTLTCRTSSMT